MNTGSFSKILEPNEKAFSNNIVFSMLSHGKAKRAEVDDSDGQRFGIVSVVATEAFFVSLITICSSAENRLLFVTYLSSLEASANIKCSVEHTFTGGFQNQPRKNEIPTVQQPSEGAPLIVMMTLIRQLMTLELWKPSINMRPKTHCNKKNFALQQKNNFTLQQK